MTAAGAICLGLAVGWAAAGPRRWQAALAELTLAVTVVTVSVYLALSHDEGAAARAAVGVLLGWGVRLLVDFGLSRLATDNGRQ